MRTVIAVLLIVALASGALLAAAEKPAAKPKPVGKIVQEKLTYLGASALSAQFKDAAGQKLDIWVLGAVMFKQGQPAQLKDFAPVVGKKYTVRYFRGTPYHRMYFVMDDASVPVVNGVLKGGTPATIVKVAGKTVTCKVGAATRTYQLASSFFAKKDGKDAQVVATKPADPEVRCFTAGDQVVIVATADGKKILTMLDHDTVRKFVAAASKLP